MGDHHSSLACMPDQRAIDHRAVPQRFIDTGRVVAHEAGRGIRSAAERRRRRQAHETRVELPADQSQHDDVGDELARTPRSRNLP